MSGHRHTAESQPLHRSARCRRMASTAPRRAIRVRTPAGLLPTRERRPGYIALLVALIVGLAAVGGVLYSKAGAKTQVVVVVHEVATGHPVQRADLGTVAVAGDVTAIAGLGPVGRGRPDGGGAAAAAHAAAAVDAEHGRTL